MQEEGAQETELCHRYGLFFFSKFIWFYKRLYSQNCILFFYKGNEFLIHRYGLFENCNFITEYFNLFFKIIYYVSRLL